MFKGSGKRSQTAKVVTLIGPETHFSGTIKAKGLVRIDGVTKGTLETDGEVVIGETGNVEMEITAKNMAVAGYFKGKAELAEKLEISATGTVLGEIKAKDLAIDEGAHFSGNCLMDDEPKSLPTADEE